MSSSWSRRSFIHAAAGGTAIGLGDLSFLSGLRPVSAKEANLAPESVRLQPEIEPLVRLLETTPRDNLLEEVAHRIQKGLSYRDLLAALLLAGVKNVQPRPSVGFKFHAVLVVNSAHLASLSSPAQDRWLPIFWAIDNFKSAQARDVQEGNWTMGRVKETSIPNGIQARTAFTQAMDRWDAEAADAAVTGLARSAGANEVFEMFFRYGVRDFRSIGHKAIFVANSRRTLQAIGWQHAEPVLRSLTYALLNHVGEPNPRESDLAPDRPGRQNAELATEIRDDYLAGEPSQAATSEMLSVFRTASPEEASNKVVELLNRKIAPQSIWDALFASSTELLMRQPGIIALHAVTSTNAMRYAYQSSGDDLTRRIVLLQNAAFLPMFRARAEQRGNLASHRIDQLQPLALEEKGRGDAAALEEIFADITRDRMAAAGKVLGYLNRTSQAKGLIDSARRLIFLKGSNSHDYKFSSAVLEDYYHVSPTWRNAFLAASVFNLRGSAEQDNQLVERTRSALRA